MSEGSSSFTDSLHGPVLVAWWVLVALSFVGAMMFPVMYHFSSHGAWRRYDLGRHLMAFSVAVGWALLALLLRITLGDYPGRGLVNFSALFGLAGVAWWRSIMYILVWRKPEEVEEHELA